MSLCTYGREMRVCVCKSVSVETLTQLPYWSKMPFCRRRISVEIIYVHFPLRRQTRGLLEYLPPPNRMTRKLFGTGACHPDCGKSDWLNCGFAFCQMLNLIFCLLIHGMEENHNRFFLLHIIFSWDSQLLPHCLKIAQMGMLSCVQGKFK